MPDDLLRATLKAKAALHEEMHRTADRMVADLWNGLPLREKPVLVHQEVTAADTLLQGRLPAFSVGCHVPVGTESFSNRNGDAFPSRVRGAPRDRIAFDCASVFIDHKPKAVGRTDAHQRRYAGTSPIHMLPPLETFEDAVMRTMRRLTGYYRG